MPTRIIIMGAAGRDFHNFNVVFRDDPREPCRRLHRDPDPEHRRPRATRRSWPGPLYPKGIPIHAE